MNNPGLLSEFDPREWHAHAVTAKIYEDSILREFGEKLAQKSFRSADKKQKRLDAKLLEVADVDAVRAMVRQFISLGFGTAVKRYYEPGTKVPTEQSARSSFHRYAGLHVGSDGRRRTMDDLINSRQSYEEMLAIPRDNFYRVVEEPTAVGPRWFVWPLPPGERVPFPAAVLKERALVLADELNRTKNPLITKKWHVPECSYTQQELQHWMAPPSAFGTWASPASRPFEQVVTRVTASMEPPPLPGPRKYFVHIGKRKNGALFAYVYEESQPKVKLSPVYDDIRQAILFRAELMRSGR